MTRKTLSALLLAVAIAAPGCEKKAAAPAAQATPAAASLSEDEKAIMAFGGAIGQQLAQQVKALNLSPAELEILKKGLTASLAGEKPQYEMQQYAPLLQARAQKQSAAAAAPAKEMAAAFRDKAAAEPGALRMPSGLIYKTITPGKGASPTPKDVVRVHYHGTLPDGTVFDSSIKRGQPIEFPLSNVIPCWTEGLQHMKVGEKAKLVCPSDLAYGDRGNGSNIPPGSTLVFEVELLGIKGR
jgi:FKBP-type peptidyl-prolyl cis-trans isomerase FkpA